LEPAPFGAHRRAAVQPQSGRLAIAALDLDLPGGPRDAEGLARRLLGGEPGREVAAWAKARAHVGLLGLREQAIREPRAARQRPLQAPDLDQVDADPAHGAPARRSAIATATAIHPVTPPSPSWRGCVAGPR